MDKNLQRIEVAKCRGWKRDPNATMPWVWIMPNGKAWETESVIPRYHTDANAQFEAWRALSNDEKERFVHRTIDVAKREGVWMEDAFNLHFCEIFLRVKNLWKQEPEKNG